MMKTQGILVTLLVASLGFGCKEKIKPPNDDIVEAYSVATLPNPSDEHFSAAINNLDLKNDQEAAKHLQIGIEALEKEGNAVGGLYKVNLDKAIGSLKLMAQDLTSGKKVSEESLREMIANAEINIAHDYLSTDEVYMLEARDQALSNKSRKAFHSTLNNLKKEEGKLKSEAKKEGEALLKEGVQLEKEYQDWQQRSAEHTKKTNELFKKHYPQYYEEFYGVE